MRSLPEIRSSWLACGAVLLLQWSAMPALAASADLPSDAAVAQAIESLRVDPNLQKERQARRLRWRGEPEPDPTREPETMKDSGGFDILSWIAIFGRALMWLLFAVVVVAIGVILVRYSGRWRRTAKKESTLPTHVRDLDIRPEGLPADIGAAALELWQRGERRACLALLYRGLLSRLVHTHAVPITASSTEGDCVQLARTHLPEPSHSYARQLVQVWQNAVYGAHEPDDAAVRALCSEFATALQASSAPRIAMQPQP